MTFPDGETDEAEPVAREFWERFYALSPFQNDRPHEAVTVPMLAALLRSYASDRERAAERRGWERACEEAEKAVAKAASVHRMRAQAITDDTDRADAEAVDDDIAIEEVKADAVEYAASRIRALRERGPR